MIKYFEQYEFNERIYSFNVDFELEDGDYHPSDGITPSYYDPFTFSKIELVGKMHIKNNDEWDQVNDEKEISDVITSITIDEFDEFM